MQCLQFILNTCIPLGLELLNPGDGQGNFGFGFLEGAMLEFDFAEEDVTKIFAVIAGCLELGTFMQYWSMMLWPAV